ncbi:hypothetical protein [Geodermatophilus sp. SYSU D00815]
MSRRAGAVLVLVAAAVSGCAPVVTRTGGPAAAAFELPSSPPTAASTGEPVYAGPPEGAPPSAGPAATLHAVELSSAYPGVDRSFSEFATASLDGGAHVVLRDDDYTGMRMVTVGATGDGFAVTGSVVVPTVSEVSGMHPLADGTVLVAGQFAADSSGGPGETPDYGYEVVDPATGEADVVVVLPHAQGTDFSYEQSALSPDGATLYLYVGYSLHETDSRPDPQEVGRLFAVDVASGEVLAERDVVPDLASLSTYTSGVWSRGLVARPDGGASLVFDATPSAADEEALLPTVLSYDGDLEPTGVVQVTDPGPSVETRAVAAGVDGTVFLTVVGRDGPRVLAVGDGASSAVALADHPDGYVGHGLAVEPGQGWAHLYTEAAVQPVDLATGEVGAALPLECEGQGVRDLFSGRDGVVAVLVGECDSPAERTQYLWLATA